MALLRGFAPRSSAFVVRHAYLLHLGSSLKWWLRPVSRRSLFVFSEALICLSYTAWKMVAHPGAAPGVSWSQAKRIAVFLARDLLKVMVLPAGIAPAWDRLEDGCLICSATGVGKMVGCVGNAPTMVRQDGCFTGSSRSLRDYQPVEMVAEAGFEPAVRGV